VHAEKIVGDEEEQDSISGTSFNDDINGLGKDDSLDGREGNDEIEGGKGELHQSTITLCNLYDALPAAMAVGKVQT
jgi:hypothetical protein